MFFRIRRACRSSAPGIFLQPSSDAGVAVSGSRYLKGVSSGSSSVGEHSTLCLADPLQSPLSRRQFSVTDRKFTISHWAKLPRTRSSPPFSLGLTGWFRARCDGHQTKNLEMLQVKQLAMSIDIYHLARPRE